VDQEAFQEEDPKEDTQGATGGQCTHGPHRGVTGTGVTMEEVTIMIMIIHGTREEGEIGKHRDRG
jgi:hypothetical protein